VCLAVRHASAGRLFMSPSTYGMAGSHFFDGKRLRAYEGVHASHALRSHTRRTGRPREGARHVHTTAIHGARSSSHPCACITAGVHGGPEAWHRSGTTPRAGTPRWPYTGGETPQALHMPREARPARLASCRLLVMASPPRDARWKLLL
jgi:hypothetical protein